MTSEHKCPLWTGFTHNEVDECQQEEQDDDADGNVAFSTPQPRLVQSLLLDGHIPRLEVAVVFLTNIPSLDGLLPHRLLHRTI